MKHLDFFGCFMLVFKVLLFGIFGFAINAAVNHFIPCSGKFKNVRKFLFGGGYATGIFAFENVFKLNGQTDFFLFNKLSVPDYINRGIGVNIAENIKVNIKIGINLDYILFAKLAA